MKLFYTLIFLSLITTPLIASDLEFSLSNSGVSWNDVTLNNITHRYLADGRSWLQLRSRTTLNADLSLSFVSSQEWQRYDYSLVGKAPKASMARSRSGSYSAAFHTTDPLILIPGKNSLFNQESGDFSIDFWIFPTRMSSGEQVFLYEGALTNNGYLYLQTIDVSFEKGRIIWRFEDIFKNAEGESVTVELQSSPMLKNSWRRHSLRYSSDIGMLELLDDGNVVDIKYANSQGRESSELFTPRWQEATNKKITIGSFSGYLDDFTILPNYLSRIDFSYYIDKGSLTTTPFDLQGSAFKKAKIIGKTADGSNFRSYIRFANFRPHLEDNHIPWEVYQEDNDYSRYNKGRFVQFKIDFFSGNGSTSSPTLHDFIITKQLIPPPPRPGRVSFIRQGSGVTIRWQPLLGTDVAGYRLYFGTRPGEYFGSTAIGDSPIDVGQATEIYLDSLEIGRLYYFSVTAYDSRDIPQESAYSPEESYLP